MTFLISLPSVDQCFAGRTGEGRSGRLQLAVTAEACRCHSLQKGIGWADCRHEHGFGSKGRASLTLGAHQLAPGQQQSTVTMARPLQIPTSTMRR